MSSRIKQGLQWLGGLLLLAGISGRMAGYDFILSSSTGQQVKWNSGYIPMRVMLGSGATSDGSNFSAVLASAMQTWNAQIGTVQFNPQIAPQGAAGDGDGTNQVVFSNDIFGEAFDDNTLAITTVWLVGGNRRVEADILFNNNGAFSWDSYRGSLAGHVPEDIQRVGLHELGHVLGLDHPDQATPPQNVVAIMNSSESNIDALQSDDINGARVLYGNPGPTTSAPGNDNFSGATNINLSGGSTQVFGYNGFASKEPGEPSLAGTTGGASVWWKWTAPSGGSTVVTTTGSNFDTTLGVYTGASVSSLATIGTNDDESSPPAPHIITSKVTFNVTGGTTYYFAVDGWDGDTGSITLNLNFTPTNVAPSITTQPSNQTANAGQTAQFTVAASGSPAPTFVWQRLPVGSGTWGDLSNGGNYSGVTGPTLSISSTTAAMDGDQFRCVITNSIGSVTSSARILTVLSLANITSQPASQTVVVGSSLTLAVTISNPGAFSYQWQRNGVNVNDGARLSGTVTRTLTITNAQVADSGSYRLLIDNPAGQVVSATATVSVQLPSPPSFTTQPSAAASVVGGSASFTVAISGAPAPSYQWQRLPAGSGTWADLANNGTYAGVTTATLTINGVALSMAGDQFRCVATNSQGTATSNPATLTVILTNGISYNSTTFPTAAGVGSTVNFTVTVTNSGSKPWGANHYLMLQDGNGANLAATSLNGVAASGSTTVSLSIAAPGSLGNYAYRLLGLENGVEYFGAPLPLGLLVGVPPAFTTQPQAALVAIGGGVTLTAAASGTPAPTYQWRRNGTNITGATNSSYTIANASFGDVGSYTVVATNPVGSATSQAAMVQLKSGGNVDFNGDGHPDLVWQNRVTGQRAIWTMNGTTPVNSVPLINIPIEWDLVGTADFNGDGKPDLIWQNTTTGERAIWLMDGTTPVASRPLITIPLEWDLVGATDFNGDGKPDLLWQNTVTGQRAIWIMDGTTPVSSVPLINIPIEWDLVGTADFNGDGKPDLIWQNTTTGERAIWLMDGTTPVASRPLITIPLEWDLVGARDFDGDGKPDLLWQNTTTGERAIWLMDGTTPVASRPLITIPTEWVLVK